MRSLLLTAGLALALGACSGLAPAATQIPAPTDTRLAPTLPPAWNSTPEPERAAPDGSSSWTPTPPPTATSPPTSTAAVTRAPTPTFDFSHIRCAATAREEGVEMMTAPFFADRRIVPTMEPGVAYRAVQTFPTMVRLVQDDRTAGWIDYRLLAVNFSGPNCFEQPRYEGNLTDFDTLCFMYADPPAEAYRDGELTEPAGFDVGPEPFYVVMSQTRTTYSSCVGHAGPCFVVDASAVQTTGQCADIPHTAWLIGEGQLWSEPEAEGGEVIEPIAAGKVVYVQAESRSGQPPPGAPEEGEWVLVKYYVDRIPRAGWLWSGWVEYQ